LSLLDQGAVSGTNFLASVLIARAVTREQFGLYELAFTILTLALNVQTSLISTPYTVYSPRLSGAEQRRYSGSTLIHQFGIALLCAVCLLAAGAVLRLGLGPAGLGGVLQVLALIITFVLLREYVRRVCFAHLRMRTALAVDCVAGVLQLGGVALLFARGALSVERGYMLAGVGGLAGGLLGLAAVRGLLELRPARAASDLARNWRLGKWTLASVVGATASAELYPWFLAVFQGTDATGVLAACNRVVFLANPFLLGMMNFLAPRAAHACSRSRRELDRLVLCSTGFMLVVMLVFFAATALLAETLLGLLYGSRYSGWRLAVAVLALRHVVAALNVPVNAGLLAIERADLIFKSYLIGAAVSFGLGIPLVRAFGVSGAVWAMVASTTATVVFRHCHFWLGDERKRQLQGLPPV